MDGPHLKYTGRVNTYAVKVSNPGDAPAKHIVVRYQMPKTYKFVSASDGGRLDVATRTVTWQWDELRPEATRSVQLRLEALHGYPARHFCSVTADDGLHAEDSFGGNMGGGIPALLIEVVDREDPVVVGGIAVYEVRVTTTGSEPFTNVRLQTQIPPGMGLKHIEGPLAYQVAGNEVTFAAIEKLGRKEDLIFHIECNVLSVASERVRFKATLDTDELPDPLIEMESTRVLERDRPD